VGYLADTYDLAYNRHLCSGHGTFGKDKGLVPFLRGFRDQLANLFIAIDIS
jgi:hypothetical protein